MKLPYEWTVGWRYVRNSRGMQRNAFVSFIAAASMAGIALGVAALIIVLSVMNGFQREVRDRMLGAIAHVEVIDSGGRALPDPAALTAQVKRHPQVAGVAPFIAVPSMLARGELMRGALVRGIEPAEEAQVTPMVQALPADMLQRLQPGSRQIILGRELARLLEAKAGDRIAILRPSESLNGAPRFVGFTVAGTFDAGHFEYDSGLALVHLQDAAELFGTGGAAGLQLRLVDLHQAYTVARQLAYEIGPEVVVRDWTRTNRNWFESVQIQKRMIGIILTLIVAVAAFNLVSTLVMTVTDKRADIAILRTLGASPRSIMGIFVVQGAAAGIIGTFSGAAIGLAIAWNIDVIVPAIERLLGTSFLPASIYVISRMPSQPLMSDVVPIVGVSLLLAFVATLYPSWRASRVNPAEALRYE